MYLFYTDGDYSLKDPKRFECIERDYKFEGLIYDYLGMKTFEDKDINSCKLEAKTFLEDLLCEGIQVNPTHYWLINTFYKAIDSLIKYIEDSYNQEVNTTMDTDTDTDTDTDIDFAIDDGEGDIDIYVNNEENRMVVSLFGNYEGTKLVVRITK